MALERLVLTTLNKFIAHFTDKNDGFEMLGFM